MALGRFFIASDDAPPAGEQVTVLGYDFWQIEYAGRGDVLGKRIQIGPANFTVVGVAPPDFFVNLLLSGAVVVPEKKVITMRDWLIGLGVIEGRESWLGEFKR